MIRKSGLKIINKTNVTVIIQLYTIYNYVSSLLLLSLLLSLFI